MALITSLIFSARNCHLGSTVCHAAATIAPSSAKDTMERAGMEAEEAPKCLSARTWASVGDFDRTSITKVRLEASSLLGRHAVARPKASNPPNNGRIIDIDKPVAKLASAIVESPAIIEEEAFGAPPATRIMVAAKPRFGHSFRTVESLRCGRM